ncbi:protein NCA1-like isoform X1 [Chenopodium quinoa]|uniref:protein NCA1-like isoform X1 n=2 Tax=Chenopodium quinoa TaxID=63459 RepID=UPI000B788660|nr:protein NCA1-like isoform X1 [Chenopodium quinoa]
MKTVLEQMTPVCPFVKATRPDDASSKRSGENICKHAAEHESKAKSESVDSGIIEPKCPLGYDSRSFKIGPLSCVLCKALLFESSKCVPCSHIFCKACISRFKDCPLCGADIEKIEHDEETQKVVDKFIAGHARIKRSPASTDTEEEVSKNKSVIYEDVSLERGAFLVQHAMRAFRAQNVESAKSRLSLCAADIREQLKESGDKPELCSQLGAVLGMLGDCCRAMGDAGSAITYFDESVEFLSQVPPDDMEIIHTLSVSLNKIGDLKYYDGDLQASRTYYFRSLEVRRNALLNHRDNASLTLDVAVSLAKVADVDRGLGNEEGAISGFREGVNMLQSLKIDASQVALEQRRLSVLEFLNSQITENQPDQTS